MAEYIKREDAVHALNIAFMGRTDAIKSQIDALCILERVPTADVRENVRGEWEIYDYEYDDEDEHPIIKCSRCGYLPPEEMDTYNFCPNCGVDMRGE